MAVISTNIGLSTQWGNTHNVSTVATSEKVALRDRLDSIFRAVVGYVYEQWLRLEQPHGVCARQTGQARGWSNNARRTKRMVCAFSGWGGAIQAVLGAGPEQTRVRLLASQG